MVPGTNKIKRLAGGGAPSGPHEPRPCTELSVMSTLQVVKLSSEYCVNRKSPVNVRKKRFFDGPILIMRLESPKLVKHQRRIKVK